MAAIHVHLRSVEVDRPLGRAERAELSALITRALEDRLGGRASPGNRSAPTSSYLRQVAEHVAGAVSAALPAGRPPSIAGRRPHAESHPPARRRLR